MVAKGSQMGTKWVPKGDPDGAKRSKGTPKGVKVRNRNEQVRKRVRRSMQIDAKRVQNGAKRRKGIPKGRKLGTGTKK